MRTLPAAWEQVRGKVGRIQMAIVSSVVQAIRTFCMNCTESISLPLHLLFVVPIELPSSEPWDALLPWLRRFLRPLVPPYLALPPRHPASLMHNERNHSAFRYSVQYLIAAAWWCILLRCSVTFLDCPPTLHVCVVCRKETKPNELTGSDAELLMGRIRVNSCWLPVFLT
jgi:hypothetical protein